MHCHAPFCTTPIAGPLRSELAVAPCVTACADVDEATNDQGDAFNTDRAGYSVRGDECDEGDFDEFLDEPIVMFINFIGNSERSDLAYFATHGTHEYTHVFQSVHVPAMRPAWLVEGSAEYNAYHNGGNATSTPFPYQEHGYNLTFESQMIDFSLNLRIRPMLRAAPSMKMEMMENMDEDYHSAASDEYIRELAYDMGAWAVAYIIHLSGKDQMAFWLGTHHSALCCTTVLHYCTTVQTPTNTVRPSHLVRLTWH